MLRLLVLLALLASASLVAAWAWLESPAGQERVRGWLQARGESLLGREMHIEALELDLLPFNATLTGIAIAGAEGSDAPLLRATAASVRIHVWALLSQELRIGSLRVDNPVVHWDIVEGAGPTLEVAGGGRLSLVIDNLDIVDGSIELNHRRWNLDAGMTAVNLDLQPVEGASSTDRRREGTLRIGGGGLQLQTNATVASAGAAAASPDDAATPPDATAAPQDATATSPGTEVVAPETEGEAATPAAEGLEFVGAVIPFVVDATMFAVDGARLTLANSELESDGRIEEWRRGEFSLDGRLALADLAALTGLDEATAVAGDLALDSTLTFGDAPLMFRGAVSSASLSVHNVEMTDASANLTAAADGVAVEALQLALFGGEVTADARLDLTAEPRSWAVRYAASGVDLQALTRSDALPGFRLAGSAAATGSLDWSAPWRDTITGAGTFDLSLPPETLERLALAETAEQADPPIADAGDGAEGEPLTPPGPAGAQQPAPSLPLPVGAHVEYTVDAGDLSLQNSSLELPRTRVEVEGSLGREGALAGNVHLQSQDLRMLDRFFNQIRRFRGERPVPQPFGIVGSGSVTAAIAGSLDEPTLDGVLEARSLSVANNPVGDVDGTLRLAGAALQILDLQLERDGGRADGSGRFRIGPRATPGPDYDFRLQLDRFPMEVDLPRLGVSLAAAGETTGDLTLSGNYGAAPSGSVTLLGDAVRLNNLADLRADVRLGLSPERWVADRFEISGPRGRLSGTGEWERSSDTLSARVTGDTIDASMIADLLDTDLPLAGTLHLDARLTGPFSQPDAAATVRWTDASAYGVTLGSIASSAEVRANTLAVSAIGRSDPNDPAVPPTTPSARGGGIAVPLPTVPDAGWVATLSTDLRAPRQATLRAAGDSNLALAMLAAQGYDLGEGFQVSGAVDLSGTGALGDWTAWAGSAVLEGFSVSQPGVSFSIPEPVTLDLRDEVLRVDVPRLVSEAGSIEARAAINVVERRWLEATATGSLSLEVLEVLTDELDASGSIDVSLEAEGNILAGDVGGNFDLRDVAFSHPASPWSAEGINGTVQLIDGRLDLADVRGALSGRRFDVTGSLPLSALAGEETSDPVALDLIVDGLPLQPLWQRTGPLQDVITGGETSLTLSVQGRGTDWRSYAGRVDVSELRVDMTNDLPLVMPEPTTITVAGGALEIGDPLLLSGPGTDLRITGAFLLGPFRLDARLQGSANLDPLNEITGSWGVAGRADIDVRVAGDPPDLTYDGTIDVSSGLINAPILQPIENVSARLSLESRRLRILQFTGSLGGSGAADDTNVTGDGEIQLVDGIPQLFTLDLNIAEAPLRIQRGIRMTTSADLVLEGTLERSLLSGTLDLIEGEYTRRWEGENDLLALSDSRVTGVDHPLARSMFLDLGVSAPGDLRVVNNMADVELRADLRVRGTLAEPVLLGSTTVLDGEVMLNDQRYRFLRGSIEFQNPLRTEPHLDIALETSIRQYLVTVNVSGSPARGDVNATFISSPPLSDLQLIQLLTVGDAPEEGARNQDDSIEAVGAQATQFLTRQYLNQVERGAQRVFGIDRLRLEPSVISGSGDPAARVTLGKQVTPDLWVSWTTILGTTEEQLVTLEYQLTRGIRVTATREEDGSIGIDFRFDHRFR